MTERVTGQFQLPDVRSAHDVSADRMASFLTEPDAAPASHDDSGGETDDELLARARRAAAAEMQALLAEPDDPA